MCRTKERGRGVESGPSGLGPWAYMMLDMNTDYLMLPCGSRAVGSWKVQ